MWTQIALGKVQDSKGTQKLIKGFLMKARMKFRCRGYLGHRAWLFFFWVAGRRGSFEGPKQEVQERLLAA